MMVNLKHEQTGRFKRDVKVGFSWTSLFFGFFPPIFRGDWKWALIEIVAAGLTFGLSWFVFIFIYNKLYINDMLDKGYVPADQLSEETLRSKGFIV